MSSGRVFRFTPAKERQAKHLFVFLHGCGATAQSMIPIAFRFQARFPTAALVVPSGFDPDARGGAAQDWYPTRGLNCDNHRERVAAVLPDFEDFVRREQVNVGVAASRTVLVGFSQGGTLALGLFDSVVSKVYAERAARVLEGLHVPVTLDIVEDLGHALTHHAISLGSLRLLQGIYEGRRHTIH